MLKIADLIIHRSKTDDSYELSITPGMIDRFLTTLTFVALTAMIWGSLKNDILYALILQSVVMWYCYQVLEDSVHVSIDKEMVSIMKSKFWRVFSRVDIPVNEFLGHEITEKDLRMNDKKAYRLELRFARGTTIPLSKAYVLNQRLIEEIHNTGNEIDEHLAKTNGIDFNCDTEWE